MTTFSNKLMKQLFVLSVIIGLGAPQAVLAYDQNTNNGQPTQVVQNLPPMSNGGTYNNNSYQTYPSNNTSNTNNNGYNSNYNTNTYGNTGTTTQGQYNSGYDNNYNNNSYGNNAGYNTYGNYQQPNQLQGRVVTAPAGTFVMANFSQPVSSEYARVGDRFNATLGSPITASDGSIILPSGSQLEAQVVMVKKAGRAGRNGQLDVRFTSATLPNGARVPLSARIQTEDGTGLIKGGTGKGRLGKAAVKTGVGAGLGALAGTALGPLSGGKVGRGAIFGTAVGAGGGALKAAWDKGKEAVLNAGQPVNVVLDQPLTVSPGAAPAAAPAYNNYNTQSQYGSQYNSGYGAQPNYNNNNNYNYGGGY